MRLRFLFPFIFYTLLFLFYPGDSYYFHIFAYNRALFQKQEKKITLKIEPVPHLKHNYSPDITASGAYVVDLSSFTPVLERNAHQKFLPASTVKIITALVSYDVYKPDEIITVKKEAADGQTMNLRFGEKITVENLLYGLLVHSANDAAYVLADNFGREDFINLMNKKAQKLLMRNTSLKNPSGFDETGQYISPFDLALAARELLKNKYLSKIVATKEIIISDVDYKYFHKLTNVNKLLGEIQGIGGLKTGFTQDAGENLVSFYKKNGHQFIIVIIKSEDRFADTRSIVRWIEENVVYTIPQQ